jgi:hypothetical protein
MSLTLASTDQQWLLQWQVPDPTDSGVGQRAPSRITTGFLYPAPPQPSGPVPIGTATAAFTAGTCSASGSAQAQGTMITDFRTPS